MRCRRALRATLAACAALAASAAPARDLYREGGISLEASGSLREIGLGTSGTDADRFLRIARENAGVCLPAATFADCPAFDEVGEREVWTSLTRLRVQLDARATEHLSARVVYDHEARLGILDTLESSLGGGFTAEPFADLDWGILEREHAEWRHLLYRAVVRLETHHLDLRVGRQRVAWGVGRLWNPIDRLNAIGPLAIEADQSGGVDAVRARWLLSGFTYLEAVYAAGRRSEDASAAARWAGVARDVDYSVVAGWFQEAPTVGFDLASNLGGAAGRIEAVWTDPTREVWRIGDGSPDDLPAYWQVVVSVDTNVAVGDGVYLLAEHLYNGNALGFGEGRAGALLGFFEQRPHPLDPLGPPIAAPGSPDLLGQSQVVTRGRHLTGVQAGYDFTPELRGDLLVIYDWDGRSASFFPSLRASPRDWLELTVGVQASTGPRRSEFGDAEPLGYLIAEVFF